MTYNYNELYEKLSQLQWLLKRYHIFSNAAHGRFADITKGQGRVMAALKMQSGISTKDLSYLLGIAVPSLNELLGKMEKAGYIVRQPSASDRRVMEIHLTEEGKSAQPVEHDYSTIFGCLNEDESEQFGEYIDRIIDSLKQQVTKMPDEETMSHWMKGAKARMGKEQFEHFMKVREGMIGSFGPFGSGMRPENMPGSERFSPDYDGPMPEGRDFPLGFGRPEKDGSADQE